MKILLPITLVEVALTFALAPVRCDIRGYFSLTACAGAADVRLYGFRLAALRLIKTSGGVFRLTLNGKKREGALPHLSLRPLQDAFAALKDDIRLTGAVKFGCGNAMATALAVAAGKALIKCDGVRVYPDFGGESLDLDLNLQATPTLIKAAIVLLIAAIRMPQRRVNAT